MRIESILTRRPENIEKKGGGLAEDPQIGRCGKHKTVGRMPLIPSLIFSFLFSPSGGNVKTRKRRRSNKAK